MTFGGSGTDIIGLNESNDPRSEMAAEHPADAERIRDRAEISAPQRVFRLRSTSDFSEHSMYSQTLSPEVVSLLVLSEAMHDLILLHLLEHVLFDVADFQQLELVAEESESAARPKN